MESANFYHHQQGDHHQLVDSSFSWSQTPILNETTNNINSTTVTNSMVQDMGFPFNGMGYPIENFVTHDLQRLACIKDEFSVAESYPKFLELLNCNTTSSINPNYSSYMKNNHNQQISYSNNSQHHLLSNFSNGCKIIKGGQQLINDENYCNGTLFGQIFPTISISSLNQSTTSSSSSSTISSSSFDINCLPALDILGSPRFDTRFSHHHPSLNANNLGGVSYGFNRPSVYPNKISSVSTAGRTDQSAKRPASKYIDTKANQQKKLKPEPPRSSSAPFQVRKEKLGDRIAAIQQLVAPFGKTDTASVLMEAIGYIKFLQTQVETLSVPYMKSSSKIYGVSSDEGNAVDGNTRANSDLHSRGLCLVPLSCLSYVSDGFEGIWPAP